MATHSKLGYGNSTDVDSAIENGVIDGKDLVITKDTSEFIYIRDDKTKQIIRPRERLFDTEKCSTCNAKCRFRYLCRSNREDSWS